ncbi:MAG TPA: hypothetical protein VF458_00415 [Ktedonobacteraceae bacterium]
MAKQSDVHEQTLGMSSRVGPLEIDWPRTIGYYGGISLALAFELIDPPLALFIAAIPLLKMLNRPGATRPSRFVGQLLEGAARPVGGSAEATIQLVETKQHRPHRLSIFTEARQLADQLSGNHHA